MRIVSIPKYIKTYLSGEFHSENTFSSVNKAYNNLLKGKQPDVSVVIPPIMKKIVLYKRWPQYAITLQACQLK